MKKLLLFFVLFISLGAPLVTSAAPQVSYCNIGADPVDAHRKQYLEKGEYVATLESDAFVTMRAASGKEVSCIVRKGEEVVFNTNGSLPWIKKCGNTILSGLWSPEKVGLSDTDKYLLGRNARPAYVAVVSECGVGTVCFARAEQFRFGVNIGAGLYGMSYRGLKANNYNLNNSQNQNQIAEGGDGGAGGDGGDGGAGGDGGPVNPPNGPPGDGGPVDPPNGPVNPGN
ncbi:MAG: hypothetical protein NUV49_02310 [Patescibacteria group bacterium]|nr:hypothetical protein [Patescibacteria group bacterium]